jgi:hypothetical protein
MAGSEAKKRIEAWYPAGIEQETKEMITGITRTATALLALRAGQSIGSKSESIRRYRTLTEQPVAAATFRCQSGV